MNIKSSKWKTILVIFFIFLSAAFLIKMYLENEWNKFEVKENKTGKTMICRTAFDIMANTTYMIISKNGKVIVMDPYDVYSGPKPDLITVSHLHGDHYDEEYIGKMNCRKSISKVESFEVDGIKVISLPSSHDSGPIDNSNPSNVIYCIEVDSLKIAHLGDYSQNKLTDDQVSALKGIDILIMPSAYYPITEPSIKNVLDKLHPPIIFTTHTDNKRISFLKDHIAKSIVVDEKFSVNNAEINHNTMKLVTLERKNLNLLFAHYLVYKFTGSPLFLYIVILVVLIIVLVVFFKRRKQKSINKLSNKEI